MGICIKEALRIIQSNVTKVSFEIIPIENTQNRISAQDIYATHSLPTFNNSAMDGYGVKLSDASKKVKVIDSIFAGSSKQTNFNESQCIKIMTGARVPSSVDAVIPHELVEIVDEDYIILPSNIKQNQHVRFLGEDIKKEDKILNIGDEINFATITMLSSQGITHVKVYRQPKISVFTSGEELKLHYEKIEDYQIYNSNTPTLLARAKELGADVTFVGMAKDNIESLKEMISNSLYADFIITSGGVSVGEADFTKDAFNEFDMEVLFDGITIKPGKPTVFGKIGNTYVLNLPGNPLAAALIFEVFGKIILQILTGNKKVYHNYIATKLSEDLPNRKGRTTIIPGFFDGEYFIPSEKRLPGMVGVLHNCNSIIVLDKHNELIKKDSQVKVLPINWKFFTQIQKDLFS
ncbi:MAG TPA: molybdopterin molybdenumtransferase MoeA [Arcobacter sp.]|nr:molybdopterin molybdenumtransferase MoeA [Arcobacter sp.]HIP55394.1 molybdopterin molybdenumtransferase MoeA [Arcobacter sp.]